MNVNNRYVCMYVCMHVSMYLCVYVTVCWVCFVFKRVRVCLILTGIEVDRV